MESIISKPIQASLTKQSYILIPPEPLNQTKTDTRTILNLSTLWTNKYLMQFKLYIPSSKPRKSLNW